jgi:hypothetical protein
MNQKEYFSKLGKLSWAKRKKTLKPDTMKNLGKMGQKALQKKIKNISISA